MMGIRAEGVFKKFGNPPTTVIDNVNLEIQDGEFLSLTGKSGSGKSTLLYLLSTLDNPTEGKIEIGGRNITDMNTKELHEFRNRNMGFVFQFHYLLPEFNSIENVLMPAQKAGLLKQKRKFAEELLERFDLKDKMEHFPSQLSGGQMQRVAVARSLIMDPEYIFADEPTGALDSVNAGIVLDIFRKISKEGKKTIVYVTHDADFANAASRSVKLIDGRLA